MPSVLNVLALLKWLVVAYALICFAMWALQRHLIYMPRRDVQPPLAYGLHDFADMRLKTVDGLQVQAWFRKARPGWPTIVYFHGNGGHLGYRAHYYQLLTESGFGLLALSYRGYGASEGSPSEQGLYLDARAAMDYAAHTLALPPGQIILYGESIGTGVAVQMATEYAFAALVLQSPFTSLRARGAALYPWLPVSLLLNDRFDSLSKVSRIHVPVLLLHGAQDTIVPVADGKALFAALPEPKEAVYFPHQGHNDLDIVLLAGAVDAFARRHGLVHASP